MAFHLSWAIEGTFEVIWRVRQGGLRYVEVLRVDQGWLHVQPIDSDGSDTSEPIWVSPAAVDVLRPFTPQKPQARDEQRRAHGSQAESRDAQVSLPALRELLARSKAGTLSKQHGYADITNVTTSKTTVNPAGRKQ